MLNGPTIRRCSLETEAIDPAASTNTMSRFETEVLTQDGNVDRLNAEWVDGAMSRTPHRRVITWTVRRVRHGEQEGASYNGHFGSTCYHPLFVVRLRGRDAPRGDCAHEWRHWNRSFRGEEKGVRRYFRDAAFKPDSMSTWSSTPYGCRATRCCNRDRSTADTTCGDAAEASGDPIRRLLVSCRELGPPRRVVASIGENPSGGRIVTNMTAGPEGVVRFYNGRGTSTRRGSTR